MKNYIVISPRVGERLFKVVNPGMKVLYETVYPANADQVCEALNDGYMSEDLTVFYLYFEDTLIETFKVEDKAIQYALKEEGRSLMDTEGENYLYFQDLKESGEIGDWRVIEEDDLSIILPEYQEED